MNRIFGKSIVVGVDASPQSVRAAAVAWRIAEAARTKCQLVHAVADVRLARATGSVPVFVGGLFERVLVDARREIAGRLHRVVPPAVVRMLDVCYGRAARVLAEAVARHGAGLVVLGGKRRGTIARALSGSTAHYLVRALDVPVLVTGRRSRRIGRVLVAVDLSSAARGTLQTAAALSHAVGTRLRVLHVVEPIRYPYVVPRAPDKKAFFLESVETFKRLASAVGGVGESEMVVREGSPEVTIAEEAARWKADVVVVGSQGKGFVDRLLIGSTTEWLLNHLPASLLVVPIASAGRSTRRTRRAHKRRRAAKAG
jgi:nucleotide-binding universal stress UspA family protein